MDDDRLLRAAERQRRKEWIDAAVIPRLEDIEQMVVRLWKERNNDREVVPLMRRFEKGAYNGCFFVECYPKDGVGGVDKWVLRIPFPESPLWNERFEADLATLRYISAHAPNIPVPKLIAWGSECPFGTPYMMMSEVPGQLLALVEWDTISDVSRAHLQRQLASIVLDLSRLRFDRIGVLATDAGTGKTVVGGRPLTTSMHSSARDGTDLDGAFTRDTTFASVAEFSQALVALHSKRFADQRSAVSLDEEDIGDPDYDLDAYFKAYIRQEFKVVAPKFVDKRFSDDGAPFCLRHGDFRYTNILVDPTTLDVTAVIDWEYCVAVPALFLHLPLRQKADPLDLVKPERFQEYWTERQSFIDSLESVESERRSSGEPVAGPPLSETLRSVTPADFWILQGIEELYHLEDLYSDFIHPDLHGGENEMVSSRKFRDELLRQEKEEGRESELLALIRRKVVDGQAFRAEVKRLGVPPTPHNG